MTSPERVSVAIALYNEEAVLPELWRRLRAVLDALPGGAHEVVFVDDGSSDGTFGGVVEIAKQDARVVGIKLSRNFGHQAALSAALDHVTGDVVVVMDGDLQDPPEAIPRLLEERARGFDVVYARRVGRKESFILRALYALFYRMIAALSDVRMPLDAGDFGLMSRRAVDRLKQMREHHRYLRGLRTWVGFRQTGVAVERGARAAGQSGYTFGKLLRLAFDGIFAFSMAPLRAAALLGCLATAGALLFAVYAVWVKVAEGRSPQGFTALILLITFFAGVQLLFLGVMGEYLGRVYEEAKGRPQYVVDRRVGRTPDAP
jgi:dolichol-phosphate mannosyltransferase